MRFCEILVTIALMIPGLLGQAPGSATPGSIEGLVCEVGTCKAITGARVVVTVFGPQPAKRQTLSDASGRFRFPQLPPAQYQLRVDADNFSLSGFIPVITLTDGQRVQGLKVEMRALGTISGHAFDENGEPLGAALVEVMTQEPPVPPHWMQPIASVETDDRGEFRIAALDPGEYSVRVTPVTTRSPLKAFPATYYPNTTDPGAAPKIVLSSGGEVSNIDLKVPTPGVKVRGRFVRPTNERHETTLMLIARNAAVQVPPVPARNMAEGESDEFEIRGVASGSYYLYVISETNMQKRSLLGRVPLEVGDRDVEGITIAVIPPGTIKGRLTVAADAINGDAFDPSGITISVGANELVPPPGMGFSATVSKTGQFDFGPVPQLTLTLGSMILPDGWFVSAERMDGGNVMASGFTSTPGKESTFEVVVSNAAGAFAGVIKDRQDKPLPAGRLLLLPAPSLRANPLLVRTTVAVERGEFSIETIPPGEYTAIAFPDEDQYTPAYLRDLGDKYERFGQQIHIGARETTRADLTVAPVELN